MKKATNRILSFLSAFAMVLGILAAPFTTASAAEETTDKVVLHKILSDAAYNNDIFPGQTGEDGKEYVGEDITKDNASTITSFFGEGSKEIAGVFFAFQKKDTDGEWWNPC